MSASLRLAPRVEQRGDPVTSYLVRGRRNPGAGISVRERTDFDGRKPWAWSSLPGMGTEDGEMFGRGYLDIRGAGPVWRPLITSERRTGP